MPMVNYVELAVFSSTATMQIFINTAAKDNHVVPPKAKTKREKLSSLDPNLLSDWKGRARRIFMCMHKRIYARPCILSLEKIEVWSIMQLVPVRALFKMGNLEIERSFPSDGESGLKLFLLGNPSNIHQKFFLFSFSRDPKLFGLFLSLIICKCILNILHLQINDYPLKKKHPIVQL